MSIKYYVEKRSHPYVKYGLAEIEVEKETSKKVTIKDYKTLIVSHTMTDLWAGKLCSKNLVYDTLPEAIKALTDFIETDLRNRDKKRDQIYSDLLKLIKLDKET